MPTFNTIELLQSLTADVKQILERTEFIRDLDDKVLNEEPAPGKWSAAQIIEHLNSYNRYYLPEIEKAIKAARDKVPFAPVFKAGIFGNYFTNMMLPGEGGKIANKMNAPKDHVPKPNLDSSKVISEFIGGQQRLISYLQLAAKTDMGKIKVPISISRFIKLKLGDTFRFLIAHQQRHFIQLDKALVVTNKEAGLPMAKL